MAPSLVAFGRAVWRHLKSLLKEKPLRYVGHDRAGSWVIDALVLLGFRGSDSSYAVYPDAGGQARSRRSTKARRPHRGRQGSA